MASLFSLRGFAARLALRIPARPVSLEKLAQHVFTDKMPQIGNRDRFRKSMLDPFLHGKSRRAGPFRHFQDLQVISSGIWIMFPPNSRATGDKAG
jgi:hypothetical protein